MSVEPDILAMRAELVIAALEGAHSQAQGVVRFILKNELKYAVVAWDRMLVFIREASPEMKAIKIAIALDQLTGEAAAEYRADRDRSRPSKKSEAA